MLISVFGANEAYVVSMGVPKSFPGLPNMYELGRYGAGS